MTIICYVIITEYMLGRISVYTHSLNPQSNQSNNPYVIN